MFALSNKKIILTMKKNYFVAILALIVNLATAQFAPTTYRGAFAPSVTQWTDQWTEFDPINASYGAVTTQITSNITTNTTWTKNNVYELKGTIFVKNNVTLTIEAGTVIRSNTNGAALIVTRGSKLNAIGTAAEPIVFTSKNAAGARGRGNWGGIVLLGKGRYNINNGEQYIEGITQSNDTQFGGGLNPINNDNSGTLQYVRIEFAGYVFAVDNELNGLTMGAVGSGTTIDHIQVSYSNDDSFEWFGGSVNCSHLVAMNGLDDDFDTDNGFNGNVQFGLALKDPAGYDISTSECFESDNSAGSGTPVGNATTDAWKTSAIFSNFTCLGPVYRATLTTPATTLNNLHDKAARLRRATELKVFNSLFLDFRRGLLFENNSVGNFTTANTTKWQNNIIAGGTPIISTTTAITDKYNAGNNSSLSSGADVILVNPYPSNSGTTTQPTYAGLDYRPGTGSPALSGAAFTDASFTGLLNVNTTELPIVAVSSYTYCKGAVATQLSAVADSNATALNWYTVGGTATVPTYTLVNAAPTPLTTAAGVKKYAVSQVLNGNESNKVIITVTTLAATTTVLGTITKGDGTAAITDVTTYVGVGSATPNVTYKTTVTLGAGETLVWLVPDGASIVSGQGTNTITVKFTNAPAGAAPYGNISVQVIGANGCPGTPKTLALKVTLPAAPAFKMLNNPVVLSAAGAPVAVTSFGEYMGTNTTLNLTVTPPAVTTATSYVWELPTGVNPVLGSVVSTTTKYYLIYPFIAPLSSIPTTLPSGGTTLVGRKYYEVTEVLYDNGVTKTSVRLLRINSFTAGTPNTITTESLGDITTTINEVAISPVFPLISTTGTTLPINFTDLTPENTYAYNSTAAISVATNAIRVGVSARNGVGLSLKNNDALAINGSVATSPALLSGSKATLLTLISTAPKAPSVKMTAVADIPATPTSPAILAPAVTIISKYVGTETPLTLTAGVTKGASSYTWILPEGVNVLNGGNIATDRVLTVNFANVAPNTPILYIQVRANNGLGSSNSLSSNATAPAPFNASTYKLLKLTAGAPAAVASTGGQITNLLCGTTKDYSLAPSALANSYVITGPTGSIVTSVAYPNNNSNVLATTEVAFSVQYPAVFVIGTSTPVADKTLTIAAVNGFGSTLKSFTLSTQALAAIGTSTNSYGTGALATKFGKCANQTIAVPNVNGVTYTWTVQNGASIVSGQGSNSIVVDFSAVTPLNAGVKNIIKVTATNGCVTTAEKAISLTWDGVTACPGAKMETTTIAPALTSTVSIYPNPAVDNFTVEFNSPEASKMTMTIFNINGSVVSSKELQLTEGNNVINENISSLSSGMYFVNFYNSANNETIVKKLVKN
jgi:hypothetical protein